jgi:hypothetical protein
VQVIGLLALVVLGLLIMAALLIGLVSIPDFRRYHRIRSM